MRFHVVLLASLMGAAVLAGCDALGDEPAAASGQVLDASYDLPASGVSVVLMSSSQVPTVLASTRTDSEGRFRLEYPEGTDEDVLPLLINDTPYNDTYSTGGYSVQVGEDSEVTTTLYRNVTLIVRAVPATPLAEGDSFYLWLPTVGTRSSTLVDTRARGNETNEVRVVVERGGVTREVVDAVYCPVGSVTEHTITF